MRLFDKVMCVGLLSLVFGCGSVSISEQPVSTADSRLVEAEAEIEPCSSYDEGSGRRVFMPQGEFYYHVRIGASLQERKYAIKIKREDKPNFYSDPSGSPTGGPPQISGYTRINRFEIFECGDITCDAKVPYKVEGKNKGTLLFDASSDPVKVTQIFDPSPGAQPIMHRFAITNSPGWQSAPPANGFQGRYFFDWESLDSNVNDLSMYAWHNEEDTPDCEINLVELSNCDRVGKPKWCPMAHQCRQVVAWRPTQSHMLANLQSCTAKCVNKQIKNSLCFRCEEGYREFQNPSGEYECRRLAGAGGDQTQSISTGQGTDRTDFVSQFQCDVNALSSTCESIGVATDTTCQPTSACGCECGGVSVSF